MDPDFLLGLALGSPIRTAAENDGEKGLKNSIGENNCFLNVVIQALWHLDPFRQKFSSGFSGPHPHTPRFSQITDGKTGAKGKDSHQTTSAGGNLKNCVHCALESIFVQYQFSDERVLPPNILREAMAVLYKNVSRFQMYELDDAAEALESVLDCLHKQKLVPTEGNSPASTPITTECKEPTCISHKVFGIEIADHVRCKTCGTSSEPQKTTLYTLYAYVAALRDASSRVPGASFGNLLYLASEEERNCPNFKCPSICKVKHRLRSLPEVLTLNVVWGSPSPSLPEIVSVLSMISLQLDVGQVFDIKDLLGLPNRDQYFYRLRGMICYYGKHYTAFFFNFNTRKWYVFDDMNVKSVGTDWAVVQERCLRGRLHPSVLFYERESIIDVKFGEQSLLGSMIPNKMIDELPLFEEKEKKEENEKKKKEEEEEEEKIKRNEEEKKRKNKEKEEEEEKKRAEEEEKRRREEREARPKEGEKEKELEQSNSEQKKENSADLSHIKISKVKRSNFSVDLTQEEEKKEEKSSETSTTPSSSSTTPATTAAPRPSSPSEESSFIFIVPSNDVEQTKEIDVEVSRIVWFRKQNRIFRFTKDCFMRVDPQTGATKEVFEYTDIYDVAVNNSNVTIRFKSGRPTQYLQSPRASDIIDVLKAVAGAHSHKFQIYNN